MKNISILISQSFFLSLASLEKIKQGISCNISFFFTIIDMKVILKEFLGLADLTKTQVLYIHKLLEVFMISKDENLIFVVFQIVAPNLQGLNNSQKLWVFGLITSFGKDCFLKEKNYWVQLTNLRLKRNLIFLDQVSTKKII